jgi:hypothetical protein
MGFALWIDRPNRLAWAQGTQEYRPMGAAVIAVTGQLRHRDFDRHRRAPAQLQNSFVGFFGSLEEVNQYLSAQSKAPPRRTPFYARD